MPAGFIVGAIAVGLGLALLRKPAAASGSSACEELAKAAGLPPGACTILGGLGKALDDLSWTDAEKQAHNDKLNGARAKVTHTAMPRAGSRVDFSRNALMAVADVSPTVLEYASGCQPFKDAPGWSKCAAGTKSLHTARGLLSGIPFRGFDSPTGTGDPTTVPHRTKYDLKASVARGGGAFPLPIPTGAEAWWFKGEPVVCEAGTTIRADAATRDHRPGANPCSPKDGSAPAPDFSHADLPVCAPGQTRSCDHRPGKGKGPQGQPCNCRLPSGGTISVNTGGRDQENR